MKLIFKHSRSAAAVIIVLSLSACARFDTRMQANGSFEYQDARLVSPYSTGDFSNAEARNNFNIPELTEQQKSVGFATNNVDVRPPTQLIPVIDGVVLEKTKNDSTKIWFNAFNQNDDMQAKVWRLIDSYLAEMGVEIIGKEESLQQLETGILHDESVFGGVFNRNYLVKESSYLLTVEKQQDGHSVALTVDALSYKETNEGIELMFNLIGTRKDEIEIRFVNNLLEYAYNVRESKLLESGDKLPLAIKLGFDDNHQNSWIVDSEFADAWGKLPDLFTLLNFKIIEDDKNLGYFLLEYSKPNDEYWDENNIKRFELDEAEYFVQLGEVTGGTTSISWLDENKKPLTDQKITDLYLSITEHVRDALIENETQTKEF